MKNSKTSYGYRHLDPQGYDIINKPANLDKKIPKEGYNFRATNYLCLNIANQTEDCGFIDTTKLLCCETTKEAMKYIIEQNKHKNVIVGEIQIHPKRGQFVILDDICAISRLTLTNNNSPHNKLIIPLTINSDDKESHGVALCINSDKEHKKLDIIVLEQHAQRDNGSLDFSKEVDLTLKHLQNDFQGLEMQVNTFQNETPICREKGVCGIVSIEMCKTLLQSDNPLEIAQSEKLKLNAEQVKKLHLQNYENYKESLSERIPLSIRDALRSDISHLEDECFGDLPIMQQRMMKSHAMMANRETYTYEKIETNKESNNSHLPDNSPQTQTAQNLVDKIVKKMMSGNSAASQKLKDFMRDKTIKVHIINRCDMDAACGGVDDKTKELHLSFCGGNFMYQKDNPNYANEDSFAVTLGHEIGHAIELQNRSSKCNEQNIQHHINGREIESFCDMFGLACAASAGYNLQSYIDKCATFEGRIKEKPNDPHPSLSSRKHLAQMAKRAYHNDIEGRTLFPEEITSMEWFVPKEVQQTKQIPLQKASDHTM